MLDKLMHLGVVTGIPSKKTGQVIYRLMPPLPGLFEFTLMRGEETEKEKKLAVLFDRLFGELSEIVQGSYNEVVNLFKTGTPITRVVPVAAEIKQNVDHILPYESINRIVDKFDTIAVATCYCRHEKNLLGKKCEVTDHKENCLFFGQTARIVIDYKFGREISKEEAKKIVLQSEKDGLVHKSFHVKSDIEKEELAICNCCKCCCGTFDNYYRGAAPTHTYTSYLARVDENECTSCEECVARCPMEAISVDDVACVDRDKCIGCGVCAYHCPAEAIILERTGKREVFVPPVRKIA
jgi:Pyruvate/2-oxoacid:ferredoxin oxidoreductase delta subunit